MEDRKTTVLIAFVCAVIAASGCMGEDDTAGHTQYRLQPCKSRRGMPPEAEAEPIIGGNVRIMAPDPVPAKDGDVFAQTVRERDGDILTCTSKAPGPEFEIIGFDSIELDNAERFSELLSDEDKADLLKILQPDGMSDKEIQIAESAFRDGVTCALLACEQVWDAQNRLAPQLTPNRYIKIVRSMAADLFIESKKVKQ